MATQVTLTNELQIELKDEAGEYTRIIRVQNPRTNITRESIATALKPALSAVSTADGGSIVPYFYDDANPNAGLTVLGKTEIVKTEKTVTTIE